MTYQAFKEGKRIMNLSAFNIDGATKREKVNQYMTRYYFADNSILRVFSGTSWAHASHPSDPRQNASFTLQINKQGA